MLHTTVVYKAQKICLPNYALEQVLAPENPDLEVVLDCKHPV